MSLRNRLPTRYVLAADETEQQCCLAENPSDVFAHLNGDAVDVWPAADGLCSAPCTFEVEKKDALERHRGTTEVVNEDEMTMTALPACQTFAERKKWESMCAFDPPESAPGAKRPARYPMYWLAMGLYQEENYDRNIVCTNPDPTAKGVRPPGRRSQRPWTFQSARSSGSKCQKP